MKLTTSTLEKAIVYAVNKHEAQLRKGDGMPYVTHPMAVMLILGQVKKSKNSILLAICCLLHDVVEDCDVSLEEIAKEFGHNVASIVSELTTDKIECDKVGKAIYLSKKMIEMSSYSLCIKLADRYHNVSDLITDGKKQETKFILNELVAKRSKLTKTHKKLIKMIRAKI